MKLDIHNFNETNLATYKEEFAEFGVVGFNNFVEKELISQMKKEWEAFIDSGGESSEMVDPEPMLTFWCHIQGEKKKLRPIHDFPAFVEMMNHERVRKLVKNFAEGQDIRLLESVVFYKPGKKSGILNWHQDVAYFPFDPNNQIAIWIPFDDVSEENGTLEYALKSHQRGLRASVDLHTNKTFENEDRPRIPDVPEEAGFPQRKAVGGPGDFFIHSGRTWHRSTPNKTNGPRRALTLRYMVGDTYYKPRAGSAAGFMAQIKVGPGDLISSPAFPLL